MKTLHTDTHIRYSWQLDNNITCRQKMRDMKKKRLHGTASLLPGRLDLNGEHVSRKQCEKLANHQMQTKQTVNSVIQLINH